MCLARSLSTCRETIGFNWNVDKPDKTWTNQRWGSQNSLMCACLVLQARAEKITIGFYWNLDKPRSEPAKTNSLRCVCLVMLSASHWVDHCWLCRVQGSEWLPKNWNRYKNKWLINSFYEVIPRFFWRIGRIWAEVQALVLSYTIFFYRDGAPSIQLKCNRDFFEGQ